MTVSIDAESARVDQYDQSHLRHLRLKGLRPKTIDAYSRTIRRLGNLDTHPIDEDDEPAVVKVNSVLDTHPPRSGQTSPRAPFSACPDLLAPIFSRSSCATCIDRGA